MIYIIIPLLTKINIIKCDFFFTKETFMKGKYGVPEYHDTPRGVKYREIKMGKGDIEVMVGDTVHVFYEGRFLNGAKIEATRFLSTRFKVGNSEGAVIPGIDEGVRGMKHGGVRQLIIPPNLAWEKLAGERASIYDVELVTIRRQLLNNIEKRVGIYERILKYFSKSEK
eukprot:GHVL01037636.1.p1 GENE.GHVL01037636.1~~GHVL01037636.1.p1  ORF type:complete len:169 (+),score=35.57 GHVL01037636.1:40-546(+)